TRFSRDWSSDVCSSDLPRSLRALVDQLLQRPGHRRGNPGLAPVRADGRRRAPGAVFAAAGGGDAEHSPLPPGPAARYLPPWAARAGRGRGLRALRRSPAVPGAPAATLPAARLG